MIRKFEAYICRVGRELNPEFLLLAISLLFFILPFAWYGPGEIDIAGDGGRIYFLDPINSFISLFHRKDLSGLYDYAHLGNIPLLALAKFLLGNSTTRLIILDHAIRLSLGFSVAYLFILEFLAFWIPKDKYLKYSALVGAFLYINLTSKYGWQHAFASQNQVFLNPLILFLLLRYFTFGNVVYSASLLILSLVYAPNFGFASSPQLFAFYPLTLIFLGLLLFRRVSIHILCNRLLFILISFIGLHSFHLIPLVASFVGPSSGISASITDPGVIVNRGVAYFDANSASIGKISTNIFHPYLSGYLGIGLIFVPLVIIYGLRNNKSVYVTIVGLFYLISLFLVSANITEIGHNFYRAMYYIPGFMMFRSFNEKWHFIYSFFSALAFSVGYSTFIRVSRRKLLVILSTIIFICSMIMVNKSFFMGRILHDYHYQSESVPATFRISPDLLETIAYVKSIKDEGRIVLFPLTFPNYQIVYGIDEGAYVGISLFSAITGRKDYAGFWTFGSLEGELLEILKSGSPSQLIHFFKSLGIKYIYHNNDPRIMKNFPGYPYIYPGELSNDKEFRRKISNKDDYNRLLNELPLVKIFEKGFFSIYQISDAELYPSLYIPKTIQNGWRKQTDSSNEPTVTLSKNTCEEISDLIPCEISLSNFDSYHFEFKKRKAGEYAFTIAGKHFDTIIPIVLQEDYHPSWSLDFKDPRITVLRHLKNNESSNLWIISIPNEISEQQISGSIKYGLRKWFEIGMWLSLFTGILLIVFIYIQINRKCK